MLNGRWGSNCNYAFFFLFKFIWCRSSLSFELNETKVMTTSNKSHFNSAFYQYKQLQIIKIPTRELKRHLAFISSRNILFPLKKKSCPKIKKTSILGENISSHAQWTWIYIILIKRVKRQQIHTCICMKNSSTTKRRSKFH